MLKKIAATTGASAHWLLTGQGPVDAPDLEAPGEAVQVEKKFISALRTAPLVRQRAAAFIVSFDNVVARLPADIRVRVLRSMRDMAVTPEWSVLRNLVGAAIERYGVSASQMDQAQSIFTPLHESLGAFGPEAMGTLMQCLESGECPKN